MITCTGSPAEKNALAYLEGSLPEFESERFEEHFFDCSVCFAHLQALQAAEEALARNPVDVVAELPRKAALSWPVKTWAWGAIAATLLLGAAVYRFTLDRPGTPQVAHTTPQPAPTPAPQPKPAQIQAAQLADLAMPAFVASSLRGESPEANFEDGMSAYLKGNCPAALASLAQVPESAREATAAAFYRGACRMKLANLPAAAAEFRRVAAAGDTPQQEDAWYYLAQIALAGNDPARAHRYLTQTIALRGDIEPRARAEDSQVLALLSAGRNEGKATLQK